MTLIDKEELLRLRQKQIRDYNPNLRALAQIKVALEDALSNANLHAHDKKILVNLLNHRLTTLYKGSKYDGLIAGAAATPTEFINTTPIDPAPNSNGTDSPNYIAGGTNVSRTRSSTASGRTTRGSRDSTTSRGGYSTLADRAGTKKRANATASGHSEHGRT